jgi:signal peptidase
MLNRNAERERSTKMTKTLSRILSLVAFGILFVLCLAFVSIRVLGFSTFIVTGGSMEPNIPKGSLVLVQPATPSEVTLGDVITFQQYGQTTTHRVISIGRNSAGLTFRTRGDANLTADPEDKWFPGQVGIVRATVPVAGYAAFAVQAYWRLAMTLIAAITFFGCAGALVLRKESADRGPRPAAPSRMVRRPVTVTVDADDAWEAHIAWIQRSARARSRTA